MEREEQDSSLKTVGFILLCCGAVKLLHLLGVITVEGESVTCARLKRFHFTASYRLLFVFSQ